jgi:hypothetical protein
MPGTSSNLLLYSSSILCCVQERRQQVKATAIQLYSYSLDSHERMNDANTRLKLCDEA